MVKPDIHTVAHQSVEILFALRAAFSVFISGVPIYIGIRYFMYRRKLAPSWPFILSFIGFFSLSAVLAFIQASPYSHYVPHWAWRPYIFLIVVLAALALVELVDTFFIRHYLRGVKNIYVSPPVVMISKTVLFALLLLPILRYTLAFNISALIAIPTVLTAAVAFAMQDTLKSAIAGIGLGNIMHIGQWISVQNNTGKVIDITWSRTVLQTGDGNLIFIPNSQLQSQIVLNYTMLNPMTQATFKVGVSYESEPLKVKEVILQAIQGVPGMAASPTPAVNILEYGESAIQYMIYFWVIDFTQVGNIKDQVASRVWSALREHKIEIPYPTRIVHMQPAEGGVRPNGRPTESSSPVRP